MISHAYLGVMRHSEPKPPDLRARRASVVEPRTVVLLLASLCACGGGLETSETARDASASEPAAGPAVLVFTRTAGYRHASIPDGVRMIRELGREHGFAVTHSEDAGVFEDETLSGTAAVVFLSTTGDILDDQQQAAFERYIRAGGAFVGIHAAADTEYDWPWYGGLVGAWFLSHPRVQPAILDIADPTHASTRMLPARWQRTDEWYNYRRNPRGDVHVLLTLDEDSYEGGEQETDHPIAWCHRYDGGRSWYTGGGHTRESFTEPLFRRHVLGGIRWVIGAESGECAA
jgi:type 1 glutamine amidotransferase